MPAPSLLAADITAGDVAAIVAAVFIAVAVFALVLVLRSLSRTLASLRLAVDDLRRSVLPLVDDAHVTVRQANAELERVDTLLGTAESISVTVDSASRLAYLALSNPVIKGLALASGTARAARRLRRPRE